MAKKFSKFLAFTAVVGVACGAVYYILGRKDNEPDSFTDDDSSDFFVNNNDREYVSLNSSEADEAADAVKEAGEDLKEAASETREAIRNKLNEAAEELKEKAQEAADGVGLVKDTEDRDTVNFEFEKLATEEDA